MADVIAAIDQGTTSTRCMLVDHAGAVVAVAQEEHAQILPRAGWVEHDALEIWGRTQEVVRQALARAGVVAGDVVAVGLTNQRETAVVWERSTGRPVHHAIVWQDTRTQRICDELGALGGGADRYRERVGLPLATYFTGPKVRWVLDHVEGARERAERGELLMGTVDSWLLWNLTGGPDGGRHLTDVSNASRTMLMDHRTLTWDEDIAAEMGVPVAMLPEIRPSSEVYGQVAEGGALAGVPVAGSLGDQQAAMFGQVCFEPGTAKSTYGTGSFLLLNTGEEPVASSHGLLTTVGYQVAGRRPVYALEGSIAVTGSLVQWLRDNLGLIGAASEIEALARTVEDNGGAYVVPAFSGLFAPRWRPDARGVVVGLTRFVNRGHLARAVLEATAYQTREVVEAMDADSGVDLTELRVDGGMVANELLMQFQADILGVPVVRPRITETTALGAAYAAGLAVGFWADEAELTAQWAEGARWQPQMEPARRERLYRTWGKAVERTLDWVDEDDDEA